MGFVTTRVRPLVLGSLESSPDMVLVALGQVKALCGFGHVSRHDLASEVVPRLQRIMTAQALPAPTRILAVQVLQGLFPQFDKAFVTDKVLPAVLVRLVRVVAEVCLSLCLSVCLSLCLSVCLPIVYCCAGGLTFVPYAMLATMTTCTMSSMMMHADHGLW